jgi:hypothetical protein
MQPVLIDGGKLVPKRLVEILDDPRVTFHWLWLLSSRARAARNVNGCEHRYKRALLSRFGKSLRHPDANFEIQGLNVPPSVILGFAVSV